VSWQVRRTANVMGRRAGARPGRPSGVGRAHGAEQVLRHESCSGQIKRGGTTGGVHPSAVRKRERVGQPIGQQTDSLRLLLGRAKEDSRMSWKHKQKENELDVQ
jgi:hypothetical protein